MAEGGGEGKTSLGRPTVFVSYASQDQIVADAVCEALERRGIACWIAPRDVTPGEFYADAIVRALNEARILVLVLTENSVASPHVLREIERTSAKRHPIISLRIGSLVLPPALEYFLSASRWLEARTTGIDSALPKLAAAVQRLLTPSTGGDAKQAGEVGELAAGFFPHSSGTGPSQRLTRPLVAIIAIMAAILGYVVVDRFWLAKHAMSEQPVAAAAPARASIEKATPKKSVAVLPFVDMSEKKDQEYFSDGLSEELIDLLTKVPNLRVPARTSAFYFKGKQTTIAEIAKALGVAHVLEGSVRKSGSNLRITVQLIRADNGYHMWSETYDRKLDDISRFRMRSPAASSFHSKPHSTEVHVRPLRAPRMRKRIRCYCRGVLLSGAHRRKSNTKTRLAICSGRSRLIRPQQPPGQRFQRPARTSLLMASWITTWRLSTLALRPNAHSCWTRLRQARTPRWLACTSFSTGTGKALRVSSKRLMSSSPLPGSEGCSPMSNSPVGRTTPRCSACIKVRWSRTLSAI